jgi:hypothetical protein
MPAVVPHSMMPTSNSTLSKRRRFQPAITSYFNSVPGEPHSHNGSIVSHNHYSAATFSPTPVVPEKVQSSLLSVGMRVRKSVADGYKTQLTIKTEKMMPPTDAITEPTFAQSRSGVNGYSELAPFSGLPKSSQEQYSADHVVTDDGDAFSLPPSSQESIGSSVPYGQKRSFENDIFIDDDISEDDVNGQDAPVGRRILSPGLGQQRRRMLALRSAMGQSTMDLDDFEEASFLRRREEVDADYSRMDCA